LDDISNSVNDMWKSMTTLKF